ncbi:hypothetical protein [Bradyrhizobium sp. 2TAF24]|uniref:hypothetical protein n=1 Tax=Bradyrhizobium sp. 2TAF24 TaxID=3233011 RepID=UPI003F91EB1C
MFEDDASGAPQGRSGSSRTALVPLTPTSAGPSLGRTRPDSCFVTQLIATATHVPQTRTLCRASPQDAQASYRATARRSQPQPAARATGAARVA